jgi:VWFA-related protein
LSLSVVAGQTAQNPPTQPPQGMPRFSASVDLIEVDVSVLDRNRQPVRGLVPADFTILENGVRQTIAAFSEVFVPEPLSQPAAWMRTATADVQVNTAAGSRLFVLVLDDAMIPQTPRLVTSVKDIGRQIVERLGPADLASVVYTMDGRKAQEFTGDRARLLAAIERFTPGFGGGDLFEGYSVGTVRKVAEYLAAVPQRRKALIYVSTGVALDLEALGPAQVGTFGDRGGQAGRLKQEMTDIFRYAQRANVNVYPIDPRGLAGFDEEPIGPNLAREYLFTLAANTGGFALANNNEFATGVTQMFRENGSYYLIGYESTDPKMDGKFRSLEVRVHRPDVVVRARTGHTPVRAEAEGDVRRPSPLAKAISGLVPVTDMAMRVMTAPFAVAGKNEAAVAIVIGLRQPAPDVRSFDDVDLVVRAFDTQGRARGVQAYKSRLTLRPAPDPEAKYEVLTRMDLAPGRYQLRIGVHSSLHGKSGSIFHDLDVPDFRREPISLSGVVLSATPPVASAGRERISPLLPIAPTTQREFIGHQSTAFLRAYQGGNGKLAPVRLVARILDAQDAVVFESVETLTPERFDKARAASYQLDVPFGHLRPGPHLLSFIASIGNRAPIHRDVPFRVH